MNSDMATLVLIAHGSRDERWRASVEAVIDMLQDELGATRVRLAYMDFTPPTLLDVVAATERAGGQRVRVLPLFLATQGHVERDIRPLVAQARAAHPAVDIELMAPMGQLEAFRAMIRNVALDRDIEDERRLAAVTGDGEPFLVRV